jgi:hypothetical protein
MVSAAIPQQMSVSDADEIDMQGTHVTVRDCASSRPLSADWNAG